MFFNTYFLHKFPNNRTTHDSTTHNSTTQQLNNSTTQLTYNPTTLQPNKAMKSDFRDLEVWKKSRDLRVYIRELAEGFPAEEKYKLTDQMIRSSRSVSANIAEGYGRYHYQDNIRFCVNARGSAHELIDHVEVALECRYIDVEKQELLYAKIEQVIALINGYMKYLKGRKLQTKN